jgi:hypothetical protein
MTPSAIGTTPPESPKTTKGTTSGVLLVKM